MASPRRRTQQQCHDSHKHTSTHTYQTNNVTSVSRAQQAARRVGTRLAPWWCSGAAEPAAGSPVPGPLARAGAIPRTRLRFLRGPRHNEGGPGLPYSPNGRPGNANVLVPPIPSSGRGTRLAACCQQQQWFTPRQLRCRRRRSRWREHANRAGTGTPRRGAERLRQFRRQGWKCRR